MSGLTTTGFQRKTLEEILADLTARAQAEFGASIRTDAASVLGHLLGIHAEPIDELWELAQVLYDSFSPDNASGDMLDNLVGLVGVVREPATKAAGTVTAFGTDGKVIPAGSIVASAVDDSQYVTLAAATIGSTTTGEVDIAIEAEVEGAQVALAAEVTVIITPVFGWTSVTNAAALTPGTDVESDSELRVRRETSLAIIGAGTDGAIRAAVLALPDVQYCRVISNRTLSTAGGIPGKAFHTIVWPNPVNTDEVHAAIFRTMPAGVQPYGAVTEDVQDEQGVAQTVGFSYATEQAIDVEIDITTSALFPANGIALIENAVLAAAALEFTVGADVRAMMFVCAANEVMGVVSAVVRMGLVPLPLSAVAIIDLADSSIATLDIADLLVTDVT